MSRPLRILLLGGSGRVGRELSVALARVGRVDAPTSGELDLERHDDLRERLHRLRPDVVVNAAAYTDVDRAESEPRRAAAINAAAPAVLAEEAARLGAVLVHYSTDFVFDGEKTEPYVEEDPPAPLGVYGRTKLEGEQAVRAAGGPHLILRTSWVYSADRDSFVTRVLRWGREKRVLRIVEDRSGSPTWCRALAEATAELLHAAAPAPWDVLRERGGTYHLAGAGAASQREWAEAILALDPRRAEQVVEEVLAATAAEFPLPAVRPRFSALDCGRIREMFGVELRPWREDLASALRILGDGTSSPTTA
jgi:dTDP-4-dehydrorhamnose reductase